MKPALRCANATIARFVPASLTRVPAVRVTILALIAVACVLAPAAARAAGPVKTLRAAFSIAETSFDPAFASDAASDAIIENVFDSMLDYDYLARPVRLVPRALEAMPTVEEGGRSYLCHVRKGIYFTPDHRERAD